MMSRRTTVFTLNRKMLMGILIIILMIMGSFGAWQWGIADKISPVLAKVDYHKILKQELSWQKDVDILGQMWDMFLGYDPTKPHEQLTAAIQFDKEEIILAAINAVVYEEVAQEYFWDSSQELSSWDKMKEKFGQVHLSDEVQVLIYHTHNAETYKATYGVSKSEGKNAGVVTAADVLQQALERKYGIRTIHNKTLHDYPNWSHSYVNSLKTVNGLLKAYPTTKIVFDVHRDAGYTSKDATTTVIDGKKAAKILLVVGANHNNYKKNLAFAQSLEDKAEELYPNLIKGIHIAQSSRYNQQAHEHSVIVEVGSDLNTQEEADYTMECFADICAAVLAEMD